MGDEFGCVPARQFDGAARLIAAQARSGFGVRGERPGPLRLSASPSRQVIATRSKPPMFLRIWFEEGQTPLDADRGQHHFGGAPTNANVIRS
jgi:hypothetical protein